MTITRTNELVKGICRYTKTKKTSSTAAADFHRGFVDTSRVERKSVEDFIQPVDEDNTKTLLFSLCYTGIVQLGKYERVTLFLDATVIPRGHRANVFVSKKGVLYPRNMLWKAASVKQVFESGMCAKADAVKKVWRHGEKMPYPGIGDMSFMQKSAELIGAGYTILEWLADAMRFLKKLLDCGVLFKLQENVAACVDGVIAFDVPWGGGSKRGFKPYAMASDFKHCDSGLG